MVCDICPRLCYVIMSNQLFNTRYFGKNERINNRIMGSESVNNGINDPSQNNRLRFYKGK